MNPKKKRVTLRLLNAAVIISPVVVATSCLTSSGANFRERSRDFDIGYVVGEMTSMNYIKYTSAVSIGHSLVESFQKKAPAYRSDLYYSWKFPDFYYSTGSYSVDLVRYGHTTGTLKAGNTAYRAIETNSDKSDIYTIRLNGKSRWANGDLLKPSDFIDALVYIIDLNTGSQLFDNVLEMDIKNVPEFIAAQVAYSKKFKTTYKNPFGYIKNKNYTASDKNSVYWVQRATKFPLQIYNKTKEQLTGLALTDIKAYLQKQREEAELISQIEFYAKNLGVYGDLNSSHPYTRVRGLTRPVLKSGRENNKHKFYDNVFYKVEGGEKIFPNVLQIRLSIKKPHFDFILGNLLRRRWIPINKKYVESIGGIEKFGTNKANFLTQGPFLIEDVTLGLSGSIILKKNENYWAHHSTIPNRIKIFMQTDPNIISSLWEDGYISYAKINALGSKDFWAQQGIRNFLKKAGGVGTTALVFNIDKNTPGYSSILDDPDLRKAIFYSIKRSEFIRLSGFDTTVPAYSFVDANSEANNEWRTNSAGSVKALQRIGSSVYYDKHTPITPRKMYPYKLSDTIVLSDSVIGNADRDDDFYNLYLARKYFFEFLKKHPGRHELVYTYNSEKPNLNIGIALQSAIKKAFGGRLKIKIKGYSPLVYDTYYQTGRFQITYRNLDYLIKNMAGGVDAFLVEDAIVKAFEKNIGFLRNPTGGWTFLKVVKSDADNLTPEEAEIKGRLEISDVVWNKIRELLTVPDELKKSNPDYIEVFRAKRITALFAKSSFEFGGKTYAVDPNFKVSFQVMELVNAANKIIMDQSPVIPLFVVDNTIYISRLVNVELGYILWNFDYGYDYKYKPLAKLPGKEAML